MDHKIYRVTQFEVVGSYKLRIRFDDGVSQTINFEPLREQAVFNGVRVDPEIHTLVWPNGADFDPATLHDWPVYEAALYERARSWAALHS